ncbi:MAG: hypothetical protein N3B18_06805 [Desulfobacterota bacterium]|nr:hypothetical protein [Thermodesulfobacteriota bacterium]
MKIIKALLVVIIVLVVIIAGIMIFSLQEGEKMYNRYATLSKELIEKSYALKDFPIKQEYRHITYPKGLGLFDFKVICKQSDRLARLSSIDATMFKCMKMFTLMIRPDFSYNLPVFSVDFIFMPFGKRVFVIEIIDPARIDDENKAVHYKTMKAAAEKLAGFEQAGVRDWYKDFITDFSLHVKSDRSQDELLLETYRTFLNAYLEMAKNARPLPQEKATAVADGVEAYVTTLLSKGGPAVEVFKKILGPEGQKDYVRTVMFGLDK